MLKIGIPGVSVRNKLRMDGFDDDIFDKHLNPETAQNGPINDDNNDESNNNDNNDDNFDDEKKEIIQEDINGHNNDDTKLPNGNNYDNNIKNNNNNNDDSNRVKGVFESSQFIPEANPELKMNTLQPVPIKKTLLIVNTFVVNTAAFLNKFVSNCENKLHKIHTDIQRMETSLKILETKLASIDWLRSAQQGNVPNLPSIQDLQETEFKDDIKVSSNDIPAPNGNNTNPNNNPSNNNDNNNDNNGVPVPPEQPAVDPLLEDEDMKQWFRMLKVCLYIFQYICIYHEKHIYKH